MKSFETLIKWLKKISSAKVISKKAVIVSIIHYDGNNFKKLAIEFHLELKTSDIIIGKNIQEQDFWNTGISLKDKQFVFLSNRIRHHGNLIDYISDFDVKKLRAFEKRGVKILVTNDKKTAWMISQMFPFYCIIPSEPFQECVITAPIPLTRNSDGYYFTKTTYRNQVTIIDLNIEILNDFKNTR